MAIKRKYKILLFIVLILALMGLFYTFFIQIRQVKAGEIGIKANMKEKDDAQPVKGYVVLIPMYTDFVTYPTTIQIVSYDSLTILSKDGIAFRIKPSMSYQLDETKVIKLYKACRSSLSELNKGYLKELVASSYSSAANAFSADSLVTDGIQFQNKVNSILSEKMGEIGLTLKSTLPNIEYPESIKSAMALRAKALQDALIEENKIRQVDALRKEDSLRYSALTPLAIQKLFIDKWDGKMPSSTGEIYRIYDSINKR